MVDEELARQAAVKAAVEERFPGPYRAAGSLWKAKRETMDIALGAWYDGIEVVRLEHPEHDTTVLDMTYVREYYDDDVRVVEPERADRSIVFLAERDE